ncbi:MAG: Glu/Leu/Phe/Val dehydrogenase [Bdellovibrionota bacterium]|nr:Glu/Leu/Phe/Val dehydrogenase [Bdellovibrionota bacterium]
MVFETIAKTGDHEQIVYCYDKDAGLKAIIAIHNTALGPALGGTRMWNYATEEDALVDVLRLSRGMTYKAAAAGLNLGGGKAVIIGDPKKDKSEALFRAFGQFINSLNGRYITAEDVGTTVKDMGHVFAETSWVTGISPALGGSGDPSPLTARGVLHAVKASAFEKFGSADLNGKKVAVQGLGKVGYYLAEYLHKNGAELIVADIDEDMVKKAEEKLKAKVVSTDEILSVDCDILAPCAMGAIINDDTISKLNCKVIAGAANNMLKEYAHGDQLHEMGILYAPDYVANAGGLMNVFVELEGYSRERALERTQGIYDNLIEIYKISKEMGIPSYKAADEMAERRLAQIGRLKQKHTGLSSRPFTTLKVEGR